jgi:hypothetical protein
VETNPVSSCVPPDLPKQKSSVDEGKDGLTIYKAR